MEEEKSKLLRYLTFKNIRNIFRTLALCFAFKIVSCSISRSSVYLSAVFEIPGVFLHRLCLLVLSHHFVFLLGNAIVVALFVKFACENQSVADDEYLIGDALFDPAVSAENLEFRSEDDQMQLRRSERVEVDDLSNEEFQREVEAFIERQWRFLKEESLRSLH